MSKVFEPKDDRQLWCVREGTGQLPVYVVPGVSSKGQELFLISPATAMDSDQYAWLQHRLDAVTQFKVKGHWIAHRERAESVLHKCDGITPSWYVVWGNAKVDKPSYGVEAPAPPELKDEMSINADRFVRHVCNYCGIPDVSATRLLWYRFCQSAVNWMIVEGRSVDMIFGKLHAVPLRRNWKAIMAAKFPGFGHLASINDQERFINALKVTEVGTQLGEAEMAGVDNEGLFSWCIELELRDSFFKHVESIERQHIKVLGPVSYYHRWLKEVSNRYSEIMASLRAYWVQSSVPVGDVDKGLPSHRRFLRWLLKEGRVRPDDPRHPPVGYCLGNQQNDDNEVRPPPPRTPPPFTLPDLPDEDIVVDLRSVGREDTER
jgi:hypothetical protein